MPRSMAPRETARRRLARIEKENPGPFAKREPKPVPKAPKGDPGLEKAADSKDTAEARRKLKEAFDKEKRRP